MNIQDINKRIEEIKEFAWDYERAHCYEDNLYEDVLKEIAKGGPNAANLAKAALKSKKIDFPRLCA